MTENPPFVTLSWRSIGLISAVSLVILLSGQFSILAVAVWFIALCGICGIVLAIMWLYSSAAENSSAGDGKPRVEASADAVTRRRGRSTSRIPSSSSSGRAGGGIPSSENVRKTVVPSDGRTSMKAGGASSTDRSTFSASTRPGPDGAGSNSTRTTPDPYLALSSTGSSGTDAWAIPLDQALADFFSPRPSAPVGFQANNESRRQDLVSPRPNHGAPSLHWHGKGEIIQIGSHTLSHPHVYTSNGQADADEASCIDARLRVGRPVREPRGALGYYPRYDRLSEDQRANYLHWLAGGRSGALDDIGYVFLYFYGLERRLLVERQDLSPIVKEVVRLLERYTFSGSFDGYLSRFLSYVLAREDIGTLKEKWFQAVFERTRTQRDEQHLAVGLAWFFRKQLPLPSAWAIRLAKLDPRAPRSVVLNRLPDQFDALFRKRYQEELGDGLLLRVAKRDRPIVYRPASPSLCDGDARNGELEAVPAPNVLGIQSQFSPVVRIWTSCIEDLKPLSRIVSRGVEVATRAAYEALPEDMRAEAEHPDKPRWERLTTEKVLEDGSVIVDVGSLAQIQEIPKRIKLTAKQSEVLACTAQAVGFMIEPDARIANRPYGWDDLVALIRPEETPTLPSDGRYSIAVLLLELGMYVAASDGEIEGDEVSHIAGFLESRFLLDPPEVRRLEALKQVFLRQPPALGRAGKRLKTILASDQLEPIGGFLVGVASSNGLVEKKEVSALRSVFRDLGIDAKVLDRLLEESRRRAKAPVEVRPGTESAAAGEAIPERRGTASRIAFKLDMASIERLLRETRQVATMLGEMRPPEESDEPEPPSTFPRLEPTSDPRFEGLEHRHAGVLAELCLRGSWPRVDFEDVVRRHSLMPAGALDRINEWAHECFSDPVLEEVEGVFLVHHQILTGKT